MNRIADAIKQWRLATANIQANDQGIVDSIGQSSFFPQGPGPQEFDPLNPQPYQPMQNFAPQGQQGPPQAGFPGFQSFGKYGALAQQMAMRPPQGAQQNWGQMPFRGVPPGFFNQPILGK